MPNIGTIQRHSKSANAWHKKSNHLRNVAARRETAQKGGSLGSIIGPPGKVFMDRSDAVQAAANERGMSKERYEFLCDKATKEALAENDKRLSANRRNGGRAD